MLDFQPLRKHRTDFPSYSFMGSAAEVALLPAEHQAQMHFLDAEGSRFVDAYLDASYLMRRATDQGNSRPFRTGYFKHLETHQNETPAALKKWLYERGIPFRHEVLLHGCTSNQDVLLTWKMLIKYAKRIFRVHDWLVFDETLYWALFYHHDGLFTFGRDRSFAPEEQFQQMYAQQELRRRYPFLKFPY
ncbi:hypothetical protein [Hymenobacter jeollabukensis]|uniref:Uncharacterized protein n=1 Tax=Hymenobacter jeollabukensis TaxID=2025313 RepID=A0A5R8WL83_9BACT|nr:hypothetical protein [Hymenobacter jeollabukensis]TLM89437.1 hypothetical protein FDY95_20400 [Hymenobacter jeollabukensis]